MRKSAWQRGVDLYAAELIEGLEGQPATRENKWLLTSNYNFESHNCWQYEELPIDENGVIDFVYNSDY